jgi:hypothetical protein
MHMAQAHELVLYRYSPDFCSCSLSQIWTGKNTKKKVRVHV